MLRTLTEDEIARAENAVEKPQERVKSDGPPDLEREVLYYPKYEVTLDGQTVAIDFMSYQRVVARPGVHAEDQTKVGRMRKGLDS